MVSRIALIVLLVAVLVSLLYLRIQIKKGKAIVIVFGTLNLSDVNTKALTVPLPTVNDATGYIKGFIGG